MRATVTTIFGTDAKAVCGVAHAGLMVASLIMNQWELLDDAITGARVDKMSLCMEDINDRLEGMDEKLDTIMDYLNTPQGRRPEFPLK